MKQFKQSLSFWPSKSGNGYVSLKLTQELISELTQAQVGGRLFLAEAKKTGENSPSYRISILPPNDSQPTPL